jgi:hypothetical protein
VAVIDLRALEGETIWRIGRLEGKPAIYTESGKVYQLDSTGEDYYLRDRSPEMNENTRQFIESARKALGQ